MLDHSKFTFDEILRGIWSSLRDGVKHGQHPYHTPVLASASEQNPDIRTVVLRRVDEEQRMLVCHTDIRSPKVSGFRQNPQSAWLFYDRQAKVQLRLYGEVSIHHADDLAAARWEKSAPSSRRCYHAAHAPGLVLSSDGVRASDLDDGFDNFAVISSGISAIDWLFLQAAGHVRARFEWDRDQWRGEWIAP